jgi:hypothetical protein
VSINSKAEFEVVLSDILLNLERISYERPNDAALVQARRDLKLVGDAVKRDGTTKQLIDRFGKASEVARAAANDADFDDRLFDLADFMTGLL